MHPSCNDYFRTRLITLNIKRCTEYYWGRNLKKKTLADWFLSYLDKPNTQTLHFHDWTNNLTWKDNTISYQFPLVISRRPCQLSSFKTVFLDLIFIREQLVDSVMELKNTYFWVSVGPSLIQKSVLILSLDSLSKTTQCMFRSHPLPRHEENFIVKGLKYTCFRSSTCCERTS